MIWIAAASALPTLAGANSPGFERPVPDRIDASIDDVDAHVVNGVRELSYGAAVALAIPGVGSFCSASMITPTVAITAGHCVQGQLSPELIVQAGEVRWGQNVEEPHQTAKIVRVILHPNYRSLTGQSIPVENDLALVEIEPVPYTETVWINEEPVDESSVGLELLAVGYGVNENGTSSSGRKRSAVHIFDSILDVFMVSDAASNPDNAIICSGDSGGPLYGEKSDGRSLQYAVHSWSQAPLGGGTCGGIAGSTSTAAYLPFILNSIEQIHGSEDMCANREANDDAFCDPECPDDVICAIQEAGGKSCQTGPSAPWFFSRR